MNKATPNARGTRGFSLVELLIALAIGSVLIIGAVYVYSQSRRTSTVSDTVARLQENGRYVMAVLEPDIQLAGYYGFSNKPDDFKLMKGGVTTTVLPAAKMQAASAPVADVGAHTCGNNFAVNLIATIEGENNNYTLGCNALGGGAQANADRLTIRRAASTPTVESAGRLQLLVSRLSPSNQFVFADGDLPATPALTANLVEVRDLIVRSYYVAANSSNLNSTNGDIVGLPALRVKSLTGGAAPSFGDDIELMRGVEDLQIQFGIDTGDYDGNGTIDPGRDTNNDGIPDVANGIATRYVNPGDAALLPGIQIVSVRVWLMLRAETPELGFVDNQRYIYADRDITPNDNFRRVLMSRTIQLRNARTL